MDKVYKELDEAKAEIEELKADVRAKTDSFENLKKSHNAQVNQIKEAKVKAERLTQELLQKADELAEAKQVCEDLKGNLNKKESIIKHLSAANDKLQVVCDDKFKRWEDEKRGLVLALEEANEKVANQEQQVYLYREEIESLKGCLSVSTKKRLETEKNLKASKELRERDEMFQKLEEKSRKVEDQLKWKKEQFKHLEEAHEKLRDQFRSSKKEWEMEKSMLLDEMSSVQIKLDSQIGISEDLQHQLHTCHQALAHVESQKKRLEVQISDLKLQLDNANEYQDARFQHDCLNSYQDKDIADLRYSLKTKEAHLKESKYRMEKLEQENQELKMSLKELREAQIQEAGASYSQSKLRSKLRNLEQTHKECALTLKAKEAEWNLKLEQLTADLNNCQYELETQIAAVEELQMELEGSHCLTVEMKLLNEEMSVMLLVLKQAIPEAQLKLASCKDEMDLINKETEEKICQLMKELEVKDAALISAQKSIHEEREKAACLIRQVESYESNNELQHTLQSELDRHKDMMEMGLINKEREEKICQLMKQLEMKDAALISAQKSIHEECEKAACLMRQVESYESNKELQHTLQSELDRHKDMMEESTMYHLILQEKFMQMECGLKEQLQEVHDALDSAILELDETMCERNEMEFELQIWKSVVEHLKNDLEENHVMRKELETSLLAQVDFSESLKQEKDSLVYKLEEKERRLDYLLQRIELLERELRAKETLSAVPIRGESVESSKSDNIRYLEIMEEKDKILEKLQKEVVWLEEESFRREFESAVIVNCSTESTYEHEKDNLLQLIKGKDMRRDELLQQVTSLEQKLTSSLAIFSSQLAEKQAEINLIQEACDKITASQILAALEAEEKMLMVVELEDEVLAIQQKLKLQEEKWVESEQLALDTEADSEAKQFEVRELNDRMETKLRKSDILLQQLKMENRNLLEDVTRLSSEREYLLAFIQGFSDKICEFSSADTQLMDMLRSMVESFENDCQVVNLTKDDGFFVKENILVHYPTTTKKLEAISDTRSPFKELNS